MTEVRSYLKTRAPLVALAGLLGSLTTLGMEPAETNDVQGLLGALEAESGLEVTNFAWEPSRGPITDWSWGRPVLLEARPQDEELPSRDIYRAFVRVSPEGRVLDVRALRNLTQTRRADERDLASSAGLAWYATEPVAGPGSITFLNLAGEKRGAEHSTLAHLQMGLSRLLETGTWSGLGRTDLFAGDDGISVTVGDEVHITTALASSAFSPEELFQRDIDTSHENVQLVHRMREPSPWPHWGADAGRHLFGSGAIAWAEGRAFSLWDNLRQVGYAVTSGSEDAQPIPLSPPRSKPSTSTWPPEEVAISGRGTTDGKWRPMDSRLLPSGGAPLFYQTVIHPDPERPYAALRLVAMDMRRLQLGIGAGYEDPRPDSGPPGSGQIPGDVASRVVATFNGAFKSVHGQYGMKAEGRVLVEPVDGAATVVVDESGSAGLGTWTAGQNTEDFVALRQNLDPLVAGGAPNPNGRKVWGDHLYGAGVAVERSALCYHSSGHLVYAWALEATGESLARGLAAAGCEYAIHLDMNPGHCSFSFNRVESVQPLEAQGEVLDKRMRVNPTRFIRWSPKDFFYVLRRGPKKKEFGVEFAPAPGKLPTPQSIPAIWKGTRRVGGLAIEIDRVDLSRFRFSVVPGASEARNVPRPEPDRLTSALIAWGLGHRTRGHRTGLAVGTDVLVPLHRNYASLVIEEGTLTLLPPAEPQAERKSQSIVQLPTWARDGELLPVARELGGKRERAAMCIDDTEMLYVARMTHDTPAPLAQALLDFGCVNVASMDRGSHPPPLVQRAGTKTPPHTGYAQTVLYGHAAPMQPKTHLF